MSRFKPGDRVRDTRMDITGTIQTEGYRGWSDTWYLMECDRHGVSSNTPETDLEHLEDE